MSMVLQTVIMFVRLRRNSQRHHVQEIDSDSESEAEYDDFLFESEQFDAGSLDSESSAAEAEMAPARRRLQRQKRVTIHTSMSSVDGLTSLLEDHEQPVWNWFNVEYIFLLYEVFVSCEDV